MTPYLADPDFTLYNGDALETLRGLPSESVHCALTSPPFYALRDYGTGKWEGGDAECDHKNTNWDRQLHAANRDRTTPMRQSCGKCGARRVDQQIGLEATPEAWCDALVAVFRELRRVLRKDGTVWLEVGDSYASNESGGMTGSTLSKGGQQTPHNRVGKPRRAGGLKPKDLLGQPWMLAFALRADGWWLRQCDIWSKTNAMPESATDRCTTAHSYIFQFAKAGTPSYWTNERRPWPGVRSKPAPDYWLIPKDPTSGPGPLPWDGEAFDEEVWTRRNAWRGHDYFFDADAISEPAEWARWGDHTNPKYEGTETASGWMQPKTKAELADVAGGRRIDSNRHTPGSAFNSSKAERGGNGRKNARSVWTIPTQGYAEAHFATWPEALVERIIKAGTSEKGCCPECGAPWERETERTPMVTREGPGRAGLKDASETGTQRTAITGTMLSPPSSVTTGWRPTCEHGHKPIPATLLDPFSGAGTTALVARRLGRRSIGIELNAEYCALAARRLQQMSLLAA